MLEMAATIEGHPDNVAAAVLGGLQLVVSEVYMESGDYITRETIFQRAAKQGARSLLVASKDKLRRLLGDGVTLSISSEEPPAWLVSAVIPWASG